MNRWSYLWLKLRAVAWLVLGRTEPALAIFNQMLLLWPDDAYALASRAHLFVQRKQQTLALADMARLVQLQPDKAANHFNYGYTLEEAGRLDEAWVAFERATTLDAQFDRAWYGLALVLIRLKKYDQAVAALKRNTELQPMSPYGWYQLARVHVDRHDPDEAVKVIRHLQAFEPKVAAQLVRETGLMIGPKSS